MTAIIKRIIVTIAVALLVIIVLTSTSVWAYFADTETSSGNKFTAWTSDNWTQTTVADFTAGIPSANVTIVIPGDVKLSSGAGTVTDTFDNESKINPTHTNLVVSGGQVKLTYSSSNATAILRPDGVGFPTQLSPYPGVPNYSRVNETASDGDASYVSGAEPINYQTDLYTMSDINPIANINSVTVYIQARTTHNNPNQDSAYTVIRTGTSSYNGTATTLTTTYVDYWTPYTFYPGTSRRWTWQEINDLEAGVALRSCRQTPQRASLATQVWVEVKYGAGYSLSGNLTSTNLLSGINNTSIDSFSYTASAIPAGTTLKVQFSQDSINWYNSLGASNGWDTLSVGGPSISLTGLGWSGANFYYRAQFTSDGTGTPVLDDITVHYSAKYTSGRIASQVFNTTHTGATWDALIWDATLNGGTITFEVRASDTPFASGDATPLWIPVGGTSPVTSGLLAGQYKQWRATLTTTTANTPILHEVRVWYDP